MIVLILARRPSIKITSPDFREKIFGLATNLVCFISRMVYIAARFYYNQKCILTSLLSMIIVAKWTINDERSVRIEPVPGGL